MANEWDNTLPIDHTLISDLPGESRKITAKVETVLEKEHRTLGDGNSGAEHKQGSAISFFLATASAPTTDPAGTAFVTADLGRLWWDTTTSQMKILTGVGPVVWTVLDAHLLASANTWAAIQTFSEIPIATKGIVANDTYVEARNEADDGNVSLIKAGKNVANDTEVAILPDLTRLATDADPIESTDLVVKNYTDTGDNVMYDTEGGYQNVDANTVKTKIYTRYIRGSMLSASTTAVAHLVSSGKDNIMSITAYAGNSDGGGFYGVSGVAEAASVTNAFGVRYDDTNITFTAVGSKVQGQEYRIKVEYKL
jgi:hypothetical protein